MGATGIEWTKGQNGEPGFTFNPWIGCTKILGSEPELSACLHCYAEGAAKKLETEWGPHAERRGVSDNTWLAPRAWDRHAARLGLRFRVFSGSMCDILDNHRSIRPEWRQRHFETVEATPNLDWLFLTKRPENAKKFLPYTWFVRGGWPPNVWFGFTAETQKAFDQRQRAVREVPARIRFMSGEPLLGDIWLPDDAAHWLHWVIGGGESGAIADCRDTPDVLFIKMLSRCRQLGIPYFQKQLAQISHRGAFKKFETFPPVLQVRQHPRIAA